MINELPRMDFFLSSWLKNIRHKNENQLKTYKNYYTIFYPAITFYGNESLRKFISKFIKQLIGDLNIGYEVKSISFDFHGARQLGSDRLTKHRNFNQCVKHVSKVLLSSSQDEQNRRNLREILFFLDEVSAVPISADHCKRIKF